LYRSRTERSESAIVGRHWRLSLGSLTGRWQTLKIIEIAIRNRGAVQYRTPAQTSAKPVSG
jgi:hypothetical protein